jgi:hypothetical protein
MAVLGHVLLRFAAHCAHRTVVLSILPNHKIKHAVIPNEVRNPSGLQSQNKEGFLTSFGMTVAKQFSACRATSENDLGRWSALLC